MNEAQAFGWVILDGVGDHAKLERALGLEPRLKVFVRAGTPAEVDQVLLRFGSHLPAYVHIGASDPATLATLASKIHAAEQLVFALGFMTDDAAAVSGDLSHYGGLYNAGVDIVQSNRPDLAAKFLGR